MFNPRIISHMAMNMFRLLKNRRHGTSIVDDVVAMVEDGGGSLERKREVVRTSHRAMAPPTFRILADDIACLLSSRLSSLFVVLGSSTP